MKKIDNFDEYEMQELEYCKGMMRAEDLEKKIGAATWYRVYRWPEVGQIRCVSMLRDLAVGHESIRYGDNVTEAEAELIAAVSAFWLMQAGRRLRFLESQLSIHDQESPS